jgi:hypothetical protein
MRDDLSHRCHTEPFFGIASAIEWSIETAGLVEPLQRLEGKRRLARPAGFEPATLGSGGRYSIQLSYGRIIFLTNESCFVVFLLTSRVSSSAIDPSTAQGFPSFDGRWRARRDLNPRPTGSKPGALSS